MESIRLEQFIARYCPGAGFIIPMAKGREDEVVKSVLQRMEILIPVVSSRAERAVDDAWERNGERR